MNISYAPTHLSSLIETETLFLMLIVTNKNQLQLKEKGIGNNRVTFFPFLVTQNRSYIKESSNLKYFFFLTEFLTSKKHIRKKEKKIVSFPNTFIS